MDSFDIMKYVDMALRRKYWIIIPFLLAVLGGLTYLLIAPKVYEAGTLILVQPQKVPSDFIRSIVSTGIEERLQTLTQQVTSRTNLEVVIKEYQLYNETEMIIDQKVELLREKIKIDVVRGTRGGNAFSISFRGKDPRKVMQVTNALASNFISENLKIRETQSLGTSTFLTDELESIRKRLAGRETQLQAYRQKFMGALPEQLQTNLSILERLQLQQEQLNSNLRDAENRKLIIQQQMADARTRQAQGPEVTPLRPLVRPDAGSQGGEPDDLTTLRTQLAQLETRYTPNHPDVVRLRALITKMDSEKKAETQETQPEAMPGTEAESAERAPTSSPAEDLLRPQLQQIELDLRGIRAEIKDVQSRMERYQKRVEDTPKREQELLSLARDYENIKNLYTSMLTRKLEADIAVSMEKKQKGEQFRVIDPAKIPSRPVAPDTRKIILMALVLGLGLGGGLAYLMEFMDTSYKTPEDVEKELKIPVLVSVPIRHTKKELRRMRRKGILMAVSVPLGFILSACGIVIGVKGIDTTLEYIKSMLERF